MGVKAVPCLVCGKVLENVWEDANNQPVDGVACQTSGNYGSRVFDSLDGEMLEFNVCDECLKRGAEQGRVLSGRPSRPVILEGQGLVGWEDVENELKEWTVDSEGFPVDDVRWLTEDDLYRRIPEKIHLNFSVEQLQGMFDLR